MQRDVGGIEIQDDLLGRRRLCIEKQRDQNPLDRRRIMADLVIACHRPCRRALQPTKRVATGQSRTILALGAEPAKAGRQQRIMPQLIVVVQVLTAKSQAEKTLTEKRRHTIFDTILCPMIRKAARQTRHQTRRLDHLAQQQRTAIRGHRAAAKIGHQATTFNPSKFILDSAVDLVEVPV